MRNKDAGLAHIGLILIIVLVLAGVGFAAYRLVSKQDSSSKTSSNNSTASTSTECPDPLIQVPVDISQVTSVLYPGQYRGGQYKPHGGLRFDNASSNNIEVKAPLPAKLTLGSRYIEQGETQVLLEFENACGVKYRFDHLLRLAPRIQAAVDTLPEAKVDDSRTTNFDNQIEVDLGEVIATAVGFENTGNVAVDFGVYDLRSENEASKRADFQAEHGSAVGKELAYHAVCWLKLLPESASATLLALPGGDSTSGKTSDYCD